MKHYEEYTDDELGRMTKENTPYEVYERLVIEGLLKIASDQEKEMREVLKTVKEPRYGNRLWNYNQGQSVGDAISIISLYY